MSVIDSRSEEDLKVFANVLAMTRSMVKFKRWNTSTLHKAFRWAEIIHDLLKNRENMLVKCCATGINFIDEDLFQSLQRSKETLLYCILSSPFLSFSNKNSSTILLETVRLGATKLGRDICVQTMIMALKHMIQRRRKIKAIEDRIPEITYTSLAFEMVVALSKRIKSNHSSPSLFFVLQDYCRRSFSTFNVFCKALVLTSVEVSICLFNSTYEISMAEICSVICNKNLLDILDSLIVEDIWRYIELVNESIRIQLCKRYPPLGMKIFFILQSLLESSYTREASIESNAIGKFQ